MYPNCEQVEYAITFLRSFCTKPAVPAINAVPAPIKVMNNRIEGIHSNSGEQRIIRKTPAVTIVAAWIKAETGVGPSIASGSQVCNPICADLPIAPRKRRKPIITRGEIEIPPKRIVLFKR